ncbi:tripartite tricarboxylate transporter substrate binding protein [Nonomuraea sp. NPDC046570]|uniref:tripartite tricarboxylate transporter substrate binding protein n=1 Tax=Nonomuraea sp. NPDC046570 TaxID=3155255 RepID=UPI0033D55941
MTSSRRFRGLALTISIPLVVGLTAGCGSATKQESGFPKKGKAVTLVVPFAPGGLTDLAGRLLGPALEDQLGTPVEILNKPGASSQIGLTALAQARPDGYTLGYTLLPTTPSAYLDPARKAAFTRDSFKPVANHFVIPVVAVVSKDSQIKDLKGLMAEAKAKPRQVKAGTGALGGPADMGRVLTEKTGQVEFANVQFDGGGPAMVALLGGHTDVTFGTIPEVLQYVKSGQVRAIGVMAESETDLLPGAPTFKAQGMDLVMLSEGVLSVPADTPPAVAARLQSAIDSALKAEGILQKSHDLGVINQFMTGDEAAKRWTVSEEIYAKVTG